MAEPVDVIISAFATPGRADQRAIAQDLSIFEHTKPVILQVPFQQEPGEVYSAPAFERAAAKCKQVGGGSILQGLFQLTGFKGEPRSITLVSFSGGTTFVDKVLAHQLDALSTDAVMVLDGLHFVLDYSQKPWPQELGPWVEFGMRAANDRALLVTSHTNIARPSQGSSSTTESSRFLYDAILDRLNASGLTATRKGYDLSRLTYGPPPPAVTVSGGSGERYKSITWDTMPDPKDVRSIGNAFDFDWGGNHEADHIFQAVYVQRGLWKAFLAPRVGGPVGCASVAVASVLPFAGGCYKDRTIVPSGRYHPSSELSAAVPFLLGLMAGTGAGWWMTKKGWI